MPEWYIALLARSFSRILLTICNWNKLRINKIIISQIFNKSVYFFLIFCFMKVFSQGIPVDSIHFCDPCKAVALTQEA